MMKVRPRLNATRHLQLWSSDFKVRCLYVFLQAFH